MNVAEFISLALAAESIENKNLRTAAIDMLLSEVYDYDPDVEAEQYPSEEKTFDEEPDFLYDILVRQGHHVNEDTLTAFQQFLDLYHPDLVVNRTIGLYEDSDYLAKVIEDYFITPF